VDDETEIFARSPNVLREMGTGIIPLAGPARRKMSGLMATRLSEATGRPVVYKQFGQERTAPRRVEDPMDGSTKQRRRASAPIRLCSPNPETQTSTLEQFDSLPRLADLAPDP